MSKLLTRVPCTTAKKLGGLPCSELQTNLFKGLFVPILPHSLVKIFYVLMWSKLSLFQIYAYGFYGKCLNPQEKNLIVKKVASIFVKKLTLKLQRFIQCAIF